MQDRKSHSTQKRMISNLFANSYLQHSEDLDRLSRQIIFDRLLPMISEWSKTKESVDVLRLFEWTGMDFMSAFAYGTDNYSDFLRNRKARERYFSEWDLLRHEADISKKATMEKTNMDMCKQVLDSEAHDKTDHGTSAVVFSRLYSQLSEMAKADDSGRSQEDIVRRCASEMLDHIIAAHETTGTTLTYASYHLSKDPKLQSELRSELATLQPPISPSTHTILPSPASIDRLPLLEAVIKETLRLNAPAPCREPRLVPSGGLRLHGFHIPAGTTVSCNPYCLHRNNEVFPQPFEWVPQRWMSDEEAKLEKGDIETSKLRR